VYGRRLELADVIIVGNVSREACDDDPLTGCTVTKGTIKWRREMGGNYACSAHPDEFYTIHWIDPGKIVCYFLSEL